MARFETIATNLSAAVAAGGSFNIAYPDGKSADDYIGAAESWITSQSRNPIYQKEGHFSLSFGASNITVTLNAGGFPNGEAVYLHADVGNSGSEALNVANASKMAALTPVKINLGTPVASDSDGAVASQACTAAGGLATGINGAFAADGVATFDVPRNVVAAWTGTAVLTVTGTDEYGNTLVESSGSGASMTGKKAFKTVTGVSVSADVTGLTVGTSKVLGLPAFLGDVTDVVAEIEDGVAATAGTLVEADTATATATTGDVRGTYAPNSNPDGSKAFELIALMRDPASKGVDQYAG